MEFTVAKAIGICLMAACIMSFSNPVSNFFYEYLADPNEMENMIAVSWNKTIKAEKPEKHKFHSIALGVNGGIDVIVDGPNLLRKLGTDEDAEAKIKPVDHQVINNLRQLQETFTYFHSKGAGGERFMNNKELYAKSVATSKAMPNSELYVGGNGALMAQTVSQAAARNVKVLFGGQVGPNLSPLLNPNIIVPSSLKTTDDEYHIIMEFAKDEVWAGNRAPIASRFIFSHDFTNGRMISVESFIESLNDFHPDLIVITGFHLLESQSENFWKRRLTEVAAAIHSIQPHIPIHVELASMADTRFVKDMSEKIFPLVHSIGLNEQELWMICQANGGPHCVVDDIKPELDGPPSPGVSSDIVHWMLSKYSKRQIPMSRLTRVHFHTLLYHTVVTLESSSWRYGESSVAAGARIASTQSCGDVSVHPAKVELRLRQTISLTAGGLPKNVEAPSDTTFQYAKPITSWKTNKMNFYMTPVLVCQQPVKTVGLGDAISSMGLLHSGYEFKT